MNIKKILAGGAASIVMSLGLTVGAYAAPLTNGSFESGVAIPGFPGFVMLSTGDNTSVPGWTVVSGTVDYIGDYWVEDHGTRSLDLTGSDGTAGAVSQTVTTVAGHTYEVTFDFAGNPDCAPATKTLRVNAGGAPQTYTFDVTGQSVVDMGWTSETFEFTATGPSTTLTFASLDLGFCGPALDNVVVTDVLTNKDQCKKDGWKAFTTPVFKNQGDCVSYYQSSPNATGNRKDN